MEHYFISARPVLRLAAALLVLLPLCCFALGWLLAR